MVTQVKLTRAQLEAIVGRDVVALRKFEDLFSIATVEVPASIVDLSDRVTINEGDISDNADGIADNADAIVVLDDTLQGVEIDAFTTPPKSNETDFLEFDLNAPFYSKEGVVGWNAESGTVEIAHEGGVMQEVGQELFGFAENDTGTDIPDGTVVGFAGGGEVIKVSPYVADGSVPPLNIFGVSTQLIADGARGRVTVWGAVRGIDTTGGAETWVTGDVLYADPATPGGMTNAKPTAPDNVNPVATVLVVSATVGTIFVRPTIEQDKEYGSFSVTINQTIAATNTAYTILIDTIAFAHGVSIGTPTSRVVISESGLFQFNPTFQASSTSAAAKNMWFWYRKNGTDISNSSFHVTIDKNGGYLAVGRSDIISLDAGDYVELVWAADSTSVLLEEVPATAFAPASPACILTVTQVQQ